MSNHKRPVTTALDSLAECAKQTLGTAVEQGIRNKKTATLGGFLSNQSRQKILNHTE